MEEAVEICKLRLFLKLVAQVDKVKQLEPLPDIDFNIRTGNTLVGFVSVGEIRKAAEIASDGQKQIFFSSTKDEIKQIEEDAGIVELAFKRFHEMQTEHEMDAQDFKAAKEDLRERLKVLAGKLDQYLAKEYGIDLKKKKAFEDWCSSHQPFHWFVEFYGTMSRGGFDVIIGNPPYVEYSKVKNEYKIINYVTNTCGNLYAFVQERALKIQNRNGRCGVIVLVGSMCTKRMEQLQKIYIQECNEIFLSSYSGHTCPGVLFEGAANRYSIWISKKGGSNPEIYTSKYMKWYSAERQFIFEQTFYSKSSLFIKGTCKKIHNNTEHEILKKMYRSKNMLSKYLSGNEDIYVYTTPIHWVKAFTFIPYFKGKNKKISTQLKTIKVDKSLKDCLVAILNSSLFFWWWIINSDCYHLINREIMEFPNDLELFEAKNGAQLKKINQKLMDDFNEKSKIGRRNQKTTGLVEFQVIDPKLSKSIIDEVDRVLAKHYGFTDDEFEFIANYDIKYRMGQ